jgi:hypothetical protein
VAEGKVERTLYSSQKQLPGENMGRNQRELVEHLGLEKEENRSAWASCASVDQKRMSEMFYRITHWVADSEELGSVRATLLVNFGPKGKFKRGLIHRSQSETSMLITVLRALTGT